MNFIIRKATESDFDSIFSLVYGLAVFQGTPERIVNSVDQMKEEKQYFQSYVAETSDGEIIGMASYFFAYYTWVGKSLFLDDLFVKESHRGKKVGTELLKKIFEVAADENCWKIAMANLTRLVSLWRRATPSHNFSPKRDYRPAFSRSCTAVGMPWKRSVITPASAA